ncbi:MAG TPA: CHAT domain-containing protein [Pyrinomonadaceae bacterium]|jgi:hypothetical protein
MRTITLELLRHGTAHNQLLSPLTPYLALCENHAAVTLHVPFEHNQFLYRLRSLTYKLKDESRTFQLSDTARVLGEILAEIPGLTAESNKGGEDEGQNLTHLRLIISASELALLPFELALSPNGLPGAGQHLLLQPQMPICLTREIRRVRGEQVAWPRRPRILFVSAAPPGVGSIPLEAHLLVLRRAIAPWVYYYDPGDSAQQRDRVDDHLHILPNASVEAIEEACASGRYTHVHILAHGVEVQENYDTRFALALHNARDPQKTEHVSGARLATALRATQRADDEGLSAPAVVTLASCDSGNVGSVAGAGSSIAHAIHESGVPMVVAGQFPLSFEGSVRLVECLYEGLLWGKDPRPLLYDLRRRLYTQFKENHDWASLTAYVSLPQDIDQQLRAVQIARANSSIRAAMDHADVATRRLSKRYDTRPETVEGGAAELDALIGKALDKIEKAKNRLKALLKHLPSEGARIYGNLASTEKRHAQVHFAAAQRYLQAGDAANHARHMKEHDELLLSARDFYWDSFMLDRSDCWAVVQYVSLTVLMQKSGRFEKRASLPAAGGTVREERNIDALWSLAHLLSLYDLNSKTRDVKIWAHGNLIELYLLLLVMDPDEKRLGAGEAEKRAVRHADALVDIAGRDTFEVYSTRRQLLRYLEWFGGPEGFSRPGPKAMAMAERIFQRLPEEAHENW